ncbi:MAG: hypothetical protein AAGJ29_02340 [Pseudomonadota bacterium]
MVASAILFAGLITALLVGFAVPFFRDRAQLKQVLWWLAFGPALLIGVGFLFLSGAYDDPGTLFIVLGLTVLAAVPAWLGRVIGRDAAAIWRERKTDKISETFK